MSEDISMEHIVNALQRVDNVTSGKPHTEQEVNEAAEALGVNLSDQFKAYLMKWGNLSLGSAEYYGLTISNDFVNSSVPNFVWFTLLKREQVGLPANYYVFQNNNDEAYYCLNSDTGNVVVWDNVTREVAEETNIGFFEFLMDDIEEYLEE